MFIEFVSGNGEKESVCPERTGTNYGERLNLLMNCLAKKENDLINTGKYGSV